MHRKTTALAGKRTLGLEHNAAIGLLAAIFFFIVSTAISIYTVQNVKESNVGVTQTHGLVVALDLLLIDIQDAETALRGFLLTADETYLLPYHRALPQVQSRLDTINAVATAEMRERGSVQELRAYISSKLDVMAQTLGAFQRQGAAEALVLVNSDRGRSDMEGIRTIISQLRNEATEDRSQRLSEMDTSYIIAWVSALASGVLGIGLTLIILALTRKASLARGRDQWL
jgi:CHASE3 domain sensor protein